MQNSVHLRTVSALSARALLTTAYRTFLWSSRLYSVTSPNTGLIQTTAGRPHDRSFRAKIVSLLVPTLFPKYFRSFENKKVSINMYVEDVPRRLASLRFVFEIHARDRAVKTAKTAFLRFTYCHNVV